MVDFYRLEYPDADDYYYSAAGSIPELPTNYAWMNNEPLAGSRATAAGAQSGGHAQDGSMFICNGNDATHAIGNRTHQAIATSLDLLDNIARRPIAVPTYAEASTGGSTVSSITINSSEMVWLGPAGTEYPTLFQVLDTDGKEILGLLDVVCRVTAANPPPGDASLKNGFASTSVQLTVSPPIPTSTTYRLHYAKKGSLAEMPRDGMTSLALAGRIEVDGGVQKMLKTLHGGGGTWSSAWQSTIYELAKSGLYERYGRASSMGSGSEPEPEMSYDLDTAGSGSWILRDGYAPSVYSTSASNHWYDPAGAAWKAISKITAFNSANTYGGTGFVYYGGDYCAGSSALKAHDYRNTAASFLHLATNRQAEDTADYANAYTYIKYDCPCTVGYDSGDTECYIDVASPYFYHTGSSTDIQCGYDVFEFYDTSSNIRRSFLAHKLESTTRLYVRRLDGSKPGDLGSLSGTLRWHPLRACMSDGAAGTQAYAASGISMLYGLTFFGPRQHGTMAGPGQSAASGSVRYDHSAAFFSGSASNLDETPVLRWGHKNSMVAFGYAFPSVTGMLMADGDISCVAIAMSGNLAQSGATKITTGTEGLETGKINPLSTTIDIYGEVTSHGDLIASSDLYTDAIYPVSPGTDVYTKGNALIEGDLKLRAADKLYVDKIEEVSGGAGYIDVSSTLKVLGPKELHIDILDVAVGFGDIAVRASLDFAEGLKTDNMSWNKNALGTVTSLPDKVTPDVNDGFAEIIMNVSATGTLTIELDNADMRVGGMYLFVVRGDWSTSTLTVTFSGGTSGLTINEVGGPFSYAGTVALCSVTFLAVCMGRGSGSELILHVMELGAVY